MGFIKKLFKRKRDKAREIQKSNQSKPKTPTAKQNKSMGIPSAKTKTTPMPKANLEKAKKAAGIPSAKAKAKPKTPTAKQNKAMAIPSAKAKPKTSAKAKPKTSAKKLINSEKGKPIYKRSMKYIRGRY
jgi:hypothetical protein